MLSKHQSWKKRFFLLTPVPCVARHPNIDCSLTKNLLCVTNCITMDILLKTNRCNQPLSGDLRQLYTCFHPGCCARLLFTSDRFSTNHRHLSSVMQASNDDAEPLCAPSQPCPSSLITSVPMRWPTTQPQAWLLSLETATAAGLPPLRSQSQCGNTTRGSSSKWLPSHLLR